MPRPLLVAASRLLPGLLCLTIGHSSFSQDFIRLHFRHISPRTGLSASYVRRSLRDPYGFMWIATEDGLDRYDGKNFIVYDKGRPFPNNLTGTDIWDIVLDTADRLVWAISSYGGIDAIDYRTGNIAFAYSQMENKATSHLRFTSIALADGKIWLGSTDGVFFLDLKERKLQKLSIENPFGKPGSPLVIDRLFIDASGRYWLLCREAGLLLLDGHKRTQLGWLSQDQLHSPNQSPVRFYDCIQQKDGSLLAATNFGLRSFWAGTDGKIGVDGNPFPDVPLSQGHDIYSCKQDKNGDTWFCTAGALVKTLSGPGSFALIREHTSRDEFKWLDAVFDIYIDKDDDLWLGCQHGLAFAQNKRSCFTSIHGSSVSDAVIRQAYFIYPLSDTLLYCCAQGGLFKVNSRNGAIYSIDALRPYYHACRDPFGRLLVANSDGTFVLQGSTLVPIGKVYSEFSGLPKIVINSHSFLGDSIIVFGTENDRGILCWNYHRRKITGIDKNSPDLHLQENTVNTVYKDARDHIWVLGDNSATILDFRTGKTHSLNTYDPSLQKSYSIFFDVCNLGGLYYLASYGSGVIVLDSQYHFIRHISVDEGLSSNSVYKILPYKDSLLIVTSNNGLSVIDLQHSSHIRKYYESDGLHSDIFEENSGAVCNGLLYAGGADGMTVIDPSLFPAAHSPADLYPNLISIQTATHVTDTSNILLTSLEIPSDALQTTIAFSAFHYDNPDRCSFAYRIGELKGGWINIGKRDFINFIGQSPGVYTVQVRTANADGAWSDKIMELTLTFLPKWYQTIWFKMLIVGLIATSFYALYRYRLSQIKKQQLIRQNISSDLHDDIGSLLNTIQIFTRLAQRSEPDRYLPQIDRSLTQATISLRDMIWVLDDAFDTIQELLERIRQFASPIADAHSIKLDIGADGKLYEQTLRPAEKRNLLLIAREAINNSIKYADCSLISIRFRESSESFSMQIEDNGKGFEPSTQKTGNGLKNILHRAAQIHYVTNLETAPGKGTRITLQKH